MVHNILSQLIEQKDYLKTVNYVFKEAREFAFSGTQILCLLNLPQKRKTVSGLKLIFDRKVSSSVLRLIIYTRNLKRIPGFVLRVAMFAVGEAGGRRVFEYFSMYLLLLRSVRGYHDVLTS
jgi:hypothetical protein